MNRRKLIGSLAAMVQGILLFPSNALARQNASDISKSPHAAALSLVLEGQQDAISKGEAGFFQTHGTDRFRGSKEQYWWFDTLQRSWSVTRPFAPGQIDSTHWFQVSYSIDKTVVCNWFVDTSKRTVQLATK